MSSCLIIIDLINRDEFDLKKKKKKKSITNCSFREKKESFSFGCQWECLFIYPNY